MMQDESGDGMESSKELGNDVETDKGTAMLSQHATDLLIGLMYADHLDVESSHEQRTIFRGGKDFFATFAPLTAIKNRTTLKRARWKLQACGALLSDQQQTHKHYHLAQTPWQIFKQFNSIMASPVRASRTYDAGTFAELLKLSGVDRKNFPLHTEGVVMLQAATFGSDQPLIYAVSQLAYDRLLKAELALKIAGSMPDHPDRRLVSIQTWSTDPALVSRWLHAGMPTPQADPLHYYLSVLSSSSVELKKDAAQLVAALLH